MKICKYCKVEKSLEEFGNYKKTKDGKDYLCKVCASINQKLRRERNLEKFRIVGARSMRNRSQEKKLLDRARERAREKNLPFKISVNDIIIPEYCPIFGTELIKDLNKASPSHSPSLDRIIPHLGYIPENIWVISLRANKIKNDASLEELRLILLALEKKLK